MKFTGIKLQLRGLDSLQAYKNGHSSHQEHSFP